MTQRARGVTAVTSSRRARGFWLRGRRAALVPVRNASGIPARFRRFRQLRRCKESRESRSRIQTFWLRNVAVETFVLKSSVWLDSSLKKSTRISRISLRNLSAGTLRSSLTSTQAARSLAPISSETVDFHKEIALSLVERRPRAQRSWAYVSLSPAYNGR